MYWKNCSNFSEIFVLENFKMAVIQTECSRHQRRSIIKCSEVKKCKPSEIYWRMCDVYGKCLQISQTLVWYCTSELKRQSMELKQIDSLLKWMYFKFHLALFQACQFYFPVFYYFRDKVISNLCVSLNVYKWAKLRLGTASLSQKTVHGLILRLSNCILTSTSTRHCPWFVTITFQFSIAFVIKF